jgi:hypothetical protein
MKQPIAEAPRKMHHIPESGVVINKQTNKDALAF